VYLLLFQGSLGGPVHALLGNTVALTLLLVGLFAWRRTGGHTHDMRALLPDGRTLGVLAVALVGVSIGLAAVIRPDELPTQPLPHALVLLMYLVAGGLLTVLLRGPAPSSTSVFVGVTWRRILTGSGAVVFASPVFGVVGASLALLVFLSYYAVAVGVGTASLGAVALTLRS
jgi:hypothetical protein